MQGQLDFITRNKENLQKVYTLSEGMLEDPGVHRGLRNPDGTGVVAGVSKVGSVQGYYVVDGKRRPMPGQLYYRGIRVQEIARAHQENGTFGFEETAYLLLMGSLPTEENLREFCGLLSEARTMPESFTENLILKVPSENIMNQLQRSVLALYSYDPMAEDNSPENIVRQSVELISRFPLIAALSYAARRHYFFGKSLYIHNPMPELSVAENLLRMIRKDKSYTAQEAHMLDLMLILHAEHSSNNSTFACRSISSSGSDTYSAIAGAVGALKGPLHGGANGKVMEMFDAIRAELGDTPSDKKLEDCLNRILDGSFGDYSGKIYGLGHAIYTVSDPRAELIKEYAAALAEEKGCRDSLALMERIEKMGCRMIMERKHQTIPMSANVDMYSGLVYQMLDIPQPLYTPLFACSRIAGWCAHRLEEVMTGGRIMRPAYRSAVEQRAYVPIQFREKDIV